MKIRTKRATVTIVIQRGLEMYGLDGQNIMAALSRYKASEACL